MFFKTKIFNVQYVFNNKTKWWKNGQRLYYSSSEIRFVKDVDVLKSHEFVNLCIAISEIP